jgi:hypothetical protein
VAALEEEVEELEEELQELRARVAPPAGQAKL